MTTSQPVVQRILTMSTPQSVPVRVTNRNQSRPSRDNYIIGRRQTTSSAQLKRMLVLGDSIFKGTHSRGLRKGVKICTTPRAMVPDIWDEISIYDLMSFAKIICIGGNYCASRVGMHAFQDKYDQLISFIKTANKDCTVYLGKILPRGDVNVTEFNRSIQRVVEHWAMHHVQYIEDTHDLFYGRSGLPYNRYFTNDAIHMSNSGVKRQLDALKRHIDIVDDFQLCVFQSRFKKQRIAENGAAVNTRPVTSNGDQGFNRCRRDNSRICYGCLMPGDIQADCWHVQ